MCSRNRCLVLFCQQVFLLGAHQIRTVDGEKLLALLHILIGRIRKDAANPARKARLHIREPLLIHGNAARSLQCIAYVFHLHDCGRDADLLHALGRELKRRERGLFGFGSAGIDAGRRLDALQDRAPQPDRRRLAKRQGVSDAKACTPEPRRARRTAMRSRRARSSRFLSVISLLPAQPRVRLRPSPGPPFSC